MANDHSRHFVEQSDKIVIDVKTREADDTDIPDDTVSVVVSKMPYELIGIVTRVEVGEWIVFMGTGIKTHFQNATQKKLYIDTDTDTFQNRGWSFFSDWTEHESEFTDVIDKLNAMMQIEDGCIRFGDQYKWMRAVTQTILTDDIR